MKRAQTELIAAASLSKLYVAADNIDNIVSGNQFVQKPFRKSHCLLLPFVFKYTT